MWLMSCRRQGMLTQGPTTDLKCKFNISSFLTLPHPLDCLICAKDRMVIVRLLQQMGDGKVGPWFIYISVWMEGLAVGIIFFQFLFSEWYFFNFFFCFCAVVNCYFMLLIGISLTCILYIPTIIKHAIF